MKPGEKIQDFTADAVVDQLGNPSTKLPKAALQWAVDHWDEAAPKFLDVLVRYEAGVDASDEALYALFYIVHVLGEKRETAAYRPFCRLILDNDINQPLLGDAITETLPCILIGLCDGDPSPLMEVIEGINVDVFVRSSALDALSYLSVTGRLPGFDIHSYFLRLFTEMRPQRQCYIWTAFVNNVARLGYEDLLAPVKELFDRGLVSRQTMDFADFEDDLDGALADPTRLAGFEDQHIWPMGSTIETLSTWYAFSPEYEKELAKQAQRKLDDAQVALNPYRDLGRNDPCPCGSGKKYKNCCRGKLLLN